MSAIHPIFVEEAGTTKADRRKTVINIVILVYVTVNALLTIFVLSDWKAQLFLKRRPDMIHAAMKVENEETKLIEQKIAQAHKETLQKILSPIVENIEK